MNIQTNKFQSIEQMSDRLRAVQAEKRTTEPEKAQQASSAISFSQVLEKQKNSKPAELKFSRHASERLASRNIDLTGEQRERLEMAVSRASAKGIQESLVMVDNLAFIVNIPNNTVITAVNDVETAVFTNIDGAVIS